MKNGQILIRFDLEDTKSNTDFVSSIQVTISEDDAGEPCVTPGQFLNLMVRVVGVFTLLANKNLKDAYQSTCHFSSLIAEVISNAVSTKGEDTFFDIKPNASPIDKSKLN